MSNLSTLGLITQSFTSLLRRICSTNGTGNFLIPSTFTEAFYYAAASSEFGSSRTFVAKTINEETGNSYVQILINFRFQLTRPHDPAIAYSSC